jgi:hypothetical protein
MAEPTADQVANTMATIEELHYRERGLKPQIRKQPESSIEVVDPETALEWLTANIYNRDLRSAHVTKLAGILLRGEWELTTDAIGFDTQGFLRNGQHRLSAIVVADQAAPVLVLRGMKAKAQDVMDQNIPRSLADALKMRGEKNWFTMASMLNWLYKLGYIQSTGNVHYRVGSERPTTPQCLAIFDTDPENLREMPRLVGRVRREIPVRTGVLAALWYKFRQIDAEEADLFINLLAEGANLDKKDAIYVLRRLLLQTRRGYEKLPDYREAAVIIKAWNAWREQKPIQQLSYKYTPTVKEPFPLPQ